MIKVELNKHDHYSYCAVCNEKKKDVKSIRFSVKDNICSLYTIDLCKECRKELIKKLVEEM